MGNICAPSGKDYRLFTIRHTVFGTPERISSLAGPLHIDGKTRTPGHPDSTKFRTVMMRKLTLQPREESFLSGYRVPELSFDCDDLPYSSLVPIWNHMRNGNWEAASAEARQAMDQPRIFHPEERAAMEMALAEAQRRLGATEPARRMAGRSLDLFPNQLASHMIQVNVLAGRKDYLAAYLHMSNLAVGDTKTTWDTVLSTTETHTLLAAWSWQLGKWDDVADHLESAYPEGIETMPAPLREDCFRLALYRNNPGDATAVASIMIRNLEETEADKVIQAIAQQGWQEEALTLYTAFYETRSESQLLRRRLVALNIKQGRIDEARRLSGSGALRLAA
ncbi:MAG: hypothetical protein COV99_10265 [Bacteroidetes bacterium CG12_big_fil_rev_8_21_14_0_65_60_17]|nr:MAG: hypothetical protein COV99_10265 [Bacteroidetes bacterium CG12_big_fil_rev_8_21_14_0_65_60_17]